MQRLKRQSEGEDSSEDIDGKLQEILPKVKETALSGRKSGAAAE